MDEERTKIRVKRDENSVFLHGIPKKAVNFADLISHVLSEALILLTIQREETCLERFKSPGRGAGLKRLNGRGAYYLMEMGSHLGFVTNTPDPFKRVIGSCNELLKALFEEQLKINHVRIKAGDVLNIPLDLPFSFRRVLIILYLVLYRAKGKEFSDMVFIRLEEEIPDCRFFLSANLELIVASYYSASAFQLLFQNEIHGKEERRA